MMTRRLSFYGIKWSNIMLAISIPCKYDDSGIFYILQLISINPHRHLIVRFHCYIRSEGTLRKCVCIIIIWSETLLLPPASIELFLGKKAKTSRLRPFLFSRDIFLTGFGGKFCTTETVLLTLNRFERKIISPRNARWVIEKVLWM